MAASGGEPTGSEYIIHHLTNARMCSTDTGLAFNKACENSGFWVWHVDTLAWSIALGILFLAIFRSAAKKADTGTPVSGAQVWSRSQTMFRPVIRILK